MEKTDIEVRLARIERELDQLKKALIETVKVSLNSGMYVMTEDKSLGTDKFAEIESSIKLIKELLGASDGEKAK